LPDQLRAKSIPPLKTKPTSKSGGELVEPGPAQSVLEAIALENFRLIATNAQKLHQLSQAAEWQVRRTPEYQRFTAEFARQADALGQSVAGFFLRHFKGKRV